MKNDHQAESKPQVSLFLNRGNKMLGFFLGIVLIAASGWQVNEGRKALSVYKANTSTTGAKTAEKATTNSPMRAYGYLYSFFFALILFVFGLGMIFGGFGF